MSTGCTQLSCAAAQQVVHDFGMDEPHPPPLRRQAVLHLLRLRARKHLLQLHLCAQDAEERNVGRASAKMLISGPRASPSPLRFVGRRRWQKRGRPSTACRCKDPHSPPICPPETNKSHRVHLSFFGNDNLCDCKIKCPLTSILDVKARLTFAMMLTTFPTLEHTDRGASLYYQHLTVIVLSTQCGPWYCKTWGLCITRWCVQSECRPRTR